MRAALDTFLERGYQRTSLSEIARRAGVGTPALYRRWRTKAAVALDIFERQAQPEPIPDTGSIRADLASFVALRLNMWSTPLYTTVVVPLALEASANPFFARQVRERFLEYRRPTLDARIRKAVAVGELRHDTSPGLLVDLLMGTVAMPLLFARDLPPVSEAQAIVDLVLDGFAAKA